ncbi:SdrD B-like domain-containing protein, partial [Staphylococcus epidermidis]|uniref:SdrD B-like domain-containing protein n=1 Tax=Staphylococcus epidermidis TaxID=1282 RepID=UPI00119CFD7C
DYLSQHTNKHPIQHHTQKPISRLKLTLKHKNPNPIPTTTTHPTPHYQFKPLQNPTYTLHFQTPSPYTPTKPNSGQHITLHSNPITTTALIN